MQVIISLLNSSNPSTNSQLETTDCFSKIAGKSILELICSPFSDKDQFIFIVKGKEKSEIEIKLTHLSISFKILTINTENVNPVDLQYNIKSLLNAGSDLLILPWNLYMHWSLKDFQSFTRATSKEIISITTLNFQPLLKVESNGKDTPNLGIYFSKNADLLLKYIHVLTSNKKGIKIIDIPLENYFAKYVLDLGNSENIIEYRTWYQYFNDAIINQANKDKIFKNTVSLIPLAGRGQRFVNEGYLTPKPLLKIGGIPMIVQAANSLPKTEKMAFAVLKEHLDSFDIASILKTNFPRCIIKEIAQVTEGQAITCEQGLQSIEENQAVFIGATDNGMLYNTEKLFHLIYTDQADAVIFTHRNYVSSAISPEMYGWVATDNDDATHLSVKAPLSDTPYNDHALVGSFYIKTVKIFRDGLQQLKQKGIRVNGEFYVDSVMHELILMGYKVKVFQVEHYICWGTPRDYEAFNYWQSFFHELHHHPFKLQNANYIKP